jgi:RimJ/RimL family protein N-acetyltransferase
MAFDFKVDYILENDVVYLRPLTENDLEHLAEFSINEPEIWKYSLVQAHGKENLKNYINIALQTRVDKKEYPFIVFDKRNGKYAGSTRFYDVQIENKTLQLGYTWYGKAFQGTGLNKNCKFLMLQFAFEAMEMERVEFRADSRNDRSIAAMKSIGCTVEGTLRNNLPTHGYGRRSSVVLSILKEEWFGGVKENLKKKIRL